MKRMRAWAAAGALLAGVLAGWVADAPGAHAAGCAGMTVDYGVRSGGGIALVPDHVSIAYGGCVVFTNKTATTASVTVAGGYHASISGFGGSATYPGKTTGRHTVTATSGPATTGGSITVGAPASSTAPHPAATAHPRRTHAASAAPPPVSTPPSAPSPPGSHARAKAKRMKSPAVPSATPPGAWSPEPTPQAAPSSSAPAIASGPIEPPSGRGVGLPAALAALAVVGTGAGLVRVLLAETKMPVDDGRAVGGAA